MDPHNILGLSPGASEKDIKAAYKKLAKKYHPDVNGGDDIKFKELGQAYDMLTKPQPEPAPGFGGFGMNDGLNPFLNEAIFNTIFRAGGGAQNFVNRVGIDPEILINGGTFDFTVQSIERVQGRIRPVHKTQKITVEPDTPAMTKVGLPGGTGNRFVFLELIPGDTPKYRVTDFMHLTETQTIDVFTAMLGGEIEVVAPNRKTIKIKIPAGTQSGNVHRIRGLGLRLVDGRRGDYNVQIAVHIPAIAGDKEEIKQKLFDSILEHMK